MVFAVTALKANDLSLKSIKPKNVCIARKISLQMRK